MSEIQKPSFAPYAAMFSGCGTNYPRCKEDCYWYREEPDMGAHIPYCDCKNKFPIEWVDCKDCEQYHSKYRATNADMIRAMSDERLAEFESTLGCHPFASKENCYGVANCSACWLDWLRKEKKSETTDL